MRLEKYSLVLFILKPHWVSSRLDEYKRLNDWILFFNSENSHLTMERMNAKLIKILNKI